MKIAPRATDLRATEPTREVAAAPDRVAATLRPVRGFVPPGTLPQRTELQAELELIAGAQGLDAALFSGSRPTDVLEDILLRLLPTLELDPDARLVAVELLREELATRQALELQRAEAGTP